jgi:hypothetical protein
VDIRSSWYISTSLDPDGGSRGGRHTLDQGSIDRQAQAAEVRRSALAKPPGIRQNSPIIEKDRPLSLFRDPTPAALADPQLLETLDRLGQEVLRLRKTVLKHGHAQELFQQRVEEAVGGLSGESGERPGSGARAELSDVQVRVLLELDRAVAHLHGLARGVSVPDGSDEPEDAPTSMREGLDLLQIRVRNLHRSFGLEPIPAVGVAFDDRLHRAHSACRRPDLPEGQVVEELLPGYLLHGKVVRPALVIVNRSGEQDP